MPKNIKMFVHPRWVVYIRVLFHGFTSAEEEICNALSGLMIVQILTNQNSDYIIVNMRRTRGQGHSEYPLLFSLEI